MELDQLTHILLSRPGAVEERPFGPDILVYKAMGKMFALVSWTESPLRINLKCDPDEALLLRQLYPGAVIPGYHMNKRHWNTVILDGRVPDQEVEAMIDDSYALVVKGLRKADRAALERLSQSGREA